MSVVDKALRESQTGSPSLTVPEAIAAVLMAAISADGSIDPNEAVRIREVLETSRLLRRAANGSLQAVANRAVGLLTEYGLPAILTGCAKVIPSDLRPTAFALATDLVLADGHVSDREKAFLDELQAVLQIDDGTALEIVEVMLIKNRG